MAEPTKTRPGDQGGHVVTADDVSELYAEIVTRWALMYPLANWPWPGRTLTGADREHLDTIARDIAAAWGRDIADRVVAVRDEELERLRAVLAEANERVERTVEQASDHIGDTLRRLEETAAERDAALARATELTEVQADRDDLRARLTGAVIHAHRLTGRIAIGSEPWAVLTALLSALEAPAQTTTEETNDG